MVSVVIPSRNEKYLYKTIRDILDKSQGEIEVIAVLDGYWPPSEEIINDPRVHYIHFSTSQGMRASINAAVALSKGDFLLKTDSHCMFSPGFDTALAKDCEPNWVVVPRRKRLDPEKWALTEENKPDVDYMYLSSDLHGRIWEEKNVNNSLKNVLIDDLMSFQGSAWFMKRSYFDFLELMDEGSYGSFAQEAQEIGLKAWLSNGEVKVNKMCWYAHWHKPKDIGRGYSLNNSEREKGEEYTNKWLKRNKVWHRQTRSLSWLLSRFPDAPTWEGYAR